MEEKIKNLKIFPKVSVIMPCYNEGKTLYKAINSVLNQTYKNLELIIINDCSSDDSHIIIKSFKDDRIKYLVNKVNLGVTKSRNIALNIATGKYIACLDGDDTCEPKRLEKQISYMEGNPSCVLCGTYSDIYDGKKTYHHLTVYKDYDLKKYLIKNNPFVQSSIVYKRIVNSVPIKYNENLSLFEDYNLWISLVNKGSFYVVPTVLVHRQDIRNFQVKKTWQGYNKNKIYKLLLKTQIYAIRETRFYFSGILALIPTILKIISSFILEKKGCGKC